MGSLGQGLFVAIYGINGIGKTTQTELLVDWLKEQGYRASRLKYPMYDLAPEGPEINRYLRDASYREKHPKTAHELQELYAQNRFRYQDELTKRLQGGEVIVAEDYVGTGIAWGMTRGGQYEYLARINQDLMRPDVTVLLHGERFLTAIEDGHQNETDEAAMKVCRNFHFLLAQLEGWELVSANQAVDVVQGDIRRLLAERLSEVSVESGKTVAV